MDSKEGGPEESESELEKGIGGDVGGDVPGKPLPEHLGQDTGCSKGGQGGPCRWGPGSYLKSLQALNCKDYWWH